ncbi:store-operated calcium entry regulator STIMATE-like isoform X2 [Dreissena polymorpha]|uniref:store-operated calcium entry regulator STIMATE-like isoform X2 n=1 Tax=Dreissena polymorpha TaxID=45954 RepID=UPI0022653679|nr:store-operated calcium entry regulator STIMATE-like isoform X2 [Dreissena polymorpha]
MDSVHQVISQSAALNKTVDNAASKSEAFHCNTGYLMNALGLFLQFLLAVLAFTSLILKRFCEPKYERRPWKIWYIVSFLLDSTIGILIIYLGLKITQLIVHRRKMETLYFGEYGTPPQCSSWVGQCGLYILVMILEKILMTGLIQFSFWEDVRKIIMSPVKDPKVELVIVMFVVPLVINAFIFWVVDNFLKRNTKNTKTIYVSDDDHSVRYNRSESTARLYNRIERVEDGDSDIILTDDDPDVRHRRNDSTEDLIS